MDDQLGGNQYRKRYQEPNLRLEVMQKRDLDGTSQRLGAEKRQTQ